MTTRSVQAALTRFLKEETPRAIALAGSWGTGKTFLWNKLSSNYVRLPEASAFRVAVATGSRPELPKYAYVSLYSIGSLAELRAAIAFEMGSSPSKGGWNKFKGWFSKRSRWLGGKLHDVAGEKLDVKGVSLAPRKLLMQMYFWRVAKGIICIDDVERRGENLALKDILSLTNFLVEQRGCRVIIILNRDQLDPDDRAAWAKHSEKVLDTEIVFKPTSEESVGVGLTDVDLKPAALEAMRRCLTRMGIDNIRVISRTARSVSAILAELDNAVPRMSAALTENVASAATVLSVLKLSHGAPTPKDAFAHTWIGRKSDQMDEDERAWWDKINAAGLYLGDTMDKAVLESIEAGYPQLHTLIPAAKELAESVEAQEAKARVSTAWQAYHGSFALDDTKVAAAFVDVADEMVEREGLMNLEPYADILRAVGRADVATSVLERWARKRIVDGVDLTRDDDFGYRPKDPELVAIVARVTAEVLANPLVSLEDALDTIVSKPAGPNEINSILAAGRRELQDEIMRKPRSWRRMHNSGHTPPVDPIDFAIQRIDAAFDAIARTSELNKRRVGSLRSR